MVNKIVLFLALALFFGFNYLYPKPKKEKIIVNDILFAKPLFFRTLTNDTHTLVADKLWLLSNTVGETRSKDSFKADEMEVFRAFKTITMMDPYFFPAINYAATYLASIKKRLDLALDLIDTAMMYNKNSFNLYFLKIVLYLTYTDEKNFDDNFVATLAKKAALLPDSQKVLGRIVVKDWVEDLLIYARDKKGKKEQAKKDLEWLLKHTTNPKRKKEILKRLKELS